MKIDFKKTIESYSAPQGRFAVVSVPAAQFVMIDGTGDPNSSEDYAAAVSTIFRVAYALKFHSRNELDRDYAVMPLEALWWSDDMDAFTTARDKSRWQWTLMNMVPPWITDDDLTASAEKAAAKAAATSAAASAAEGTPRSFAPVRLESFDEGLVVQTLHVGPYDDEGPVLDEMHRVFIPESSLRLRGRHHEIYLNDARRTAPARLKTILRQPVGTESAPG